MDRRMIDEVHDFLRDYAKETGDKDLYLRFNQAVTELTERTKRVYEECDELSQMAVRDNRP